MKKATAYLLLAFIILPYAALAAACPGGSDSECSDPTPVCDTSVTPYTCVASDEAGSGAGTVHAGGACKIDGDCYGDLGCINKICQIDQNLEGAGTVNEGGACTTNDQCAGDLTCSANHLCVGNTGTPSSGADSAITTGRGFVPLTNIPALTDTTGAPNLSAFLNQLYKICIGIAVVLAVLQLIRAGITYMTAAGNVGSVDEAKKLIWASLLGLLLVLSPVIVFTIINPQILTLSIGTSVLTTNLPSGGAAEDQTPATTPVAETWACTGTNGSDCTAARAKCASLTTEKSTGTLECVGKDSQIKGEVGKIVCNPSAGDTYAIKCTGTASANGAQQAGIENDPLALPIFDGGYMDLVAFGGTDSVSKAQNYSCQNGSSQTHQSFAGTSEHTTYALCTTPQLTYTIIRNDHYPFDIDSPDTKDAYDKYTGECQRIKGYIATLNWPRVTLTTAADSPEKVIACSDAEKKKGADKSLTGTTRCVTATATCKAQ